MAKKDKNQSEKEQQARTEAAVDDLIQKVVHPEAGAPKDESTAGGEAGPGPEAETAAELEAARAEAAKNWDLYLRTRADLENIRKRAQRDKEDTARYGNEALLRELLPVLDNLERAVAHAPGEGEREGLLEGVEMTLAQLRKVLEKAGVEPVAAAGAPFDPAYHEAMGQQERSDLPANHVAQELQKGYLLKGRLLRPALVMVSRESAAPSPAEGDGSEA